MTKETSKVRQEKNIMSDASKLAEGARYAKCPNCGREGMFATQEVVTKRCWTKARETKRRWCYKTIPRVAGTHVLSCSFLGFQSNFGPCYW